MRAVYLSYRMFFFLLPLFCFILSSCDQTQFPESKLSQKFSGRYGQVEIGGKYVGLEFHHSRPLPSRFSFYYPVANSIDLSTDYWQRDRSQPYTAMVLCKDKTDSIAQESCDYSYTPYQARFEKMYTNYRLQVDYEFCDDLPLVAVQFRLKNITGQKTKYSLSTDLNMILRTCHTYAMRLPASVEFDADSQYVLARFESNDTDSCLLFFINQVGLNNPHAGFGKITGSDSIPTIQFHYTQELVPGREMNIVQLIGTCRQAEWDSLLPVIQQRFQKSIVKNHVKMVEYIWSQSHFNLPDTTLLESYYWSKAVMAANRHYLNGVIVPMPCPAEYNFFFTHDALLTDLAAVYFDIDRVRRDLIYLHSLTQPDSILPHAYYFKDGIYQTEFCTSDNWNHLWFLILAGTYYRHSSDLTTIRLIYPILQKSVDLMLQNKGKDQLMYAFRPDWWDIGHMYGARSYLTILMIQALRSYVRVSLELAQDDTRLLRYLQLSEQMEDSLSARLWDEHKGFLFNMLDTLSVDTHYYAGSLLGAVFNILDDNKSERLLQTARQKLLDPNIGIRIAMPADFHRLINVYNFNGMEMGEQYLYLNGGCWPHGTAWYILGQIQTGQIEEAYMALKKYLSLDGIVQSPNGQPSFYEYRNTDASSPQYGQIDKPTFLWAAGWYLYTLYNLAGVRENQWNIYFHPVIPAGFGERTEFDLMVFGSKARVQWQGSGKYFERILFNDQQVSSSLVYQAVRDIKLIRGRPSQPYISKSNVNLRDISFNSKFKVMNITLNGIRGQRVDIEIVTPISLESVSYDQTGITNTVLIQNDHGIRTYKIVFTIPDRQVVLNCRFM